MDGIGCGGGNGGVVGRNGEGNWSHCYHIAKENIISLANSCSLFYIDVEESSQYDYRENKVSTQKLEGYLSCKKDKGRTTCLATLTRRWWQVFGHHMRNSSVLNMPCITSILIHTVSFPPHQQAELVLIFPLGFSFYSLLVSRESGEGVFQKLYSATIDLQLKQDPAFLHQICDSDASNWGRA